MRITFYFQSDDNIVLPIFYQNILQSLIYKYFKSEFDNYLSNNNLLIRSKGKQFTFFTFSMIETPKKARFLKNINSILFPREISFTFSTVINNLDIQQIENKMKSDFIKLGDNTVFLSKMEIHKKPILSSKHNITMKSPLTITSMLNNSNGKAYTFYHHPNEKSFCFQIKDNLFRKYKAFYGKEVFPNTFSINTLNFHLIKLNYKKEIIDGYTGYYEIEGDQNLIMFAYDVGLGHRNSQGFGLFEIWDKTL